MPQAIRLSVKLRCLGISCNVQDFKSHSHYCVYSMYCISVTWCCFLGPSLISSTFTVFRAVELWYAPSITCRHRFLRKPQISLATSCFPTFQTWYIILLINLIISYVHVIKYKFWGITALKQWEYQKQNLTLNDNLRSGLRIVNLFLTYM